MARDEAAIAQLRESAAACRDCPVWEDATQVAFGQGPADAAALAYQRFVADLALARASLPPAPRR